MNSIVKWYLGLPGGVATVLMLSCYLPGVFGFLLWQGLDRRLATHCRPASFGSAAGQFAIASLVFCSLAMLIGHASLLVVIYSRGHWSVFPRTAIGDALGAIGMGMVLFVRGTRANMS